MVRDFWERWRIDHWTDLDANLDEAEPSCALLMPWNRAQNPRQFTARQKNKKFLKLLFILVIFNKFQLIIDMLSRRGSVLIGDKIGSWYIFFAYF